MNITLKSVGLTGISLAAALTAAQYGASHIVANGLADKFNDQDMRMATALLKETAKETDIGLFNVSMTKTFNPIGKNASCSIELLTSHYWLLGAKTNGRMRQDCGGILDHHPSNI